MKKSLQQHLVNYLQARPNEKVAKGKLEELAKQKMGVIGETAVSQCERNIQADAHNNAIRIAQDIIRATLSNKEV